MNDKYMIVRFYRKEGKKNKVMKTGLTLEQAQAHCSDGKTHKAGEWFDGYTKQDSQR
jgi:hypothetical protein